MHAVVPAGKRLHPGARDPHAHLLPACRPHPAGIPTDHALADAPALRPIIQRYAADQQRFFADFGEAFRKLTELGVQWV